MSAPNATMHRVASGRSLGEIEERRHLKYARRIVIKVGTPVITNADGAIAIARISSIVEQIVHLASQGKEIVLVTSGAIGHGVLRMQAQTMLSSSLREALSGHRELAIDLKAAAAVGQSGLMSLYDLLFREYNIACAQILVTEDDWSEPECLSQLRETTAELLSIGAIPIVNENDAVSQRTIPVLGAKNRVLWDNDALASRLASSLHADVLITLTDFDQLHRVLANGTPAPMAVYEPGAELWHCKEDAEKKAVDSGNPYRSRIAEEGLHVLVGSVREAMREGVRASVVASGLQMNCISRIIAGEELGTLFLGE
eukprot:CAMPEP_0206001650 /NCGR_PEP_ID=MMETSP1464-20131121/2244_1 /ASSEMBLY_ACC=CAM_ASM_001124 /TAXON_ID=119497 /ORGANISM="Exanthemachrysis gayraliae, Strain RCC1523" /LENGTH=312 /DNA_ID=CAMNT_0053374971 /DNA_START=70 /DNA_END=1008 /DNA_ORIENTATION=-